MNQITLTDFFRTGKVDTDFQVQEGFVTGICTLYSDRTAGPQEYIVREKSIVETEGQFLSTCAQKAKDLAFQSAIERLERFSPVQQPSAKPAIEPVNTEQPTQKEEPALAPKAAPMQEKDPPASPDSIREPTQIKLAPAPSAPRRLDFADLRPASSLIAPSTEPTLTLEQETGDETKRIEKARAMPITILGKLHDCNGWTAGRILDERPEIIVDMVKRYNGPKVEEKEAMKTLYSEALRKLDQAA